MAEPRIISDLGNGTFARLWARWSGMHYDLSIDIVDADGKVVAYDENNSDHVKYYAYNEHPEDIPKMNVQESDIEVSISKKESIVTIIEKELIAKEAEKQVIK